MPDSSPAAQLAAQVRDVVAPLIGDHKTVALVDYPSHMNIGDSAIWLGERRLLRDLGVSVSYVADQRSYRPDHLRRAAPDGPILLHGGGNFGDLYPKHHRLRQRVLADFPDRHVIQLPQTITFDDPAQLDASAAVFRRHPAFTLLVRDTRSLSVTGPRFTDDVHLCPDSALCLGRLKSGDEPHGVLWQAREDGESGGSGPDAPGDVTARDWPKPASTWERRRKLSRAVSLGTSLDPTGVVPALTGHAQGELFERLARERLATGARFLGAAEVVVTDRLHGHILALLCERPAVLYDNRTGKVRDFYETWTKDEPSVRFAAGPAEALETAQELLATRTGAVG